MEKLGKHRIMLLVSLSLLLLIAACGSSTTDKAASPAPTSMATSTPAASAAAAPAASEMTTLIEAAKKEGKVVYNGVANPQLQNDIISAFKKKYGIDVEYLTLSGGELLTRMDREFKANQIGVDIVSSITGGYVMSTRGQVEDLKGVMINPEVVDPTVWEEGYPYYFGGNKDSKADFIVGAQYGKEAQQLLFVNPDIIKETDIKTWQDLLKPEYKGKIVANDPLQPGVGQSTAVAIMIVLGEEYFKKLYIDQEVTLTRDLNQMAEWVVRGEHPIALGIFSNIVVGYQKNNLPIKRIFPENGPNTLTGAGGGIVLVKGAAHPNAAKLFANWLLTKESQEIYEKNTGKPSMRKDTATKGDIVDFVNIRKDIKYDYHDMTPEFFFNQNAPTVAKITKILAR